MKCFNLLRYYRCIFHFKSPSLVYFPYKHCPGSSSSLVIGLIHLECHFQLIKWYLIFRVSLGLISILNGFMQVVWLKVELCRLLEDKRSAVLRLLLYYMRLGFYSSLRIYIGSCMIATDSIREW